MKTEDIIRLGGFKAGETREEAMGKMVDLLVKVENARLIPDSESEKKEKNNDPSRVQS